MSIYTKDKEDIYFLNDKNLVDSIDGDVAVNAVPTMKLVHDSYNKLSSMTDQVSAYLSDMNNNTLLVGTDGYMSVLTEIGQNKAELCSKATTLLSSHIKGLSEFVETTSANLDNKVWLSVNYISGQTDLSASSLSDAILKEIYIKDIKSSDEQYLNGKYSNLSVVKISLEDYKNNVKAAGDPLKSNCLYVIDADHLEGYGQQLKNLAEPTDLSDATTKNYVDVRDNAISVDLVEKIEDVDENITTKINELNVPKIIAEPGKILSSISETNGIINVDLRDLISTDIPTLPESKIENLTTDLNNLSSNYVKNSDFTTKVSDEYTSFEYDEHEISLTIAGVTKKIDTAQFEQGRLLKEVSIVTIGGTERYLRLIFKLEDGSDRTIDIKLTDIATIYQGSDTIDIDNETLKIAVTKKVALSADVKAEVEAVDNKINTLNKEDTIGNKTRIVSLTLTNGLIAYTTVPLSVTDCVDYTEHVTNNITSLIEAFKNGYYESRTNEIVDNKISALDVSPIVVGDYEIFNSISEVDGKVTATKGTLTTNRISDYESTTNDKINTAVTNAINALDTSIDAYTSGNPKKFFTHLHQENGMLSTFTAEGVNAEDVAGLNLTISADIVSYIKGHFDPGTRTVAGQLINALNIADDGNIGINTTKVTNDFINDGAIAQAKIAGLTTKIENLENEIAALQTSITKIINAYNEHTHSVTGSYSAADTVHIDETPTDIDINVEGDLNYGIASKTTPITL